jgi:hypothetical protein
MLQARTSDDTAKMARSGAKPKPKQYFRRAKIEVARFSGRTREGWRVRALMRQFEAEIGEVAGNPAVALAIKNAAELVMLAELQRGKMLRGETDGFADREYQIRLEGVMQRSIAYMRELARDVRAEMQAAARNQTIQEFVASCRIDSAEPRPEASTPAKGRTAATPRKRTYGRATDGSGASQRRTSTTPSDEDEA